MVVYQSYANRVRAAVLRKNSCRKVGKRYDLIKHVGSVFWNRYTWEEFNDIGGQLNKVLD